MPDLATLQAAMNRAVERQNMALFTPIGQARELVVATLRLVIEAVADGDTALAGAILDHIQPESPPPPAASASPWAYSMTGSPAPTRRPRSTSAT